MKKHADKKEHHKIKKNHKEKMEHHKKMRDHHKEKMHELKKKHAKPKKDGKVEKVLHEFKEGSLHSGSKKGPKVKSRKQAVAIALSEARKYGEKVKPKNKK